MSLARDAFGGDRLVAVKVLDFKVLPPSAFTRLQREFLLRRGLHHPNLAAFYDLDFDDAGNCRLVSEYVGGADFLEAAVTLGPDALVDLVVQVLHALGHLHDCGLVHGALKPCNVRLTTGSEGPRLKLLDFDLRPDNEVSPAEPAGTLHHAAPEVLRGQTTDLRADLYGVGMLLLQAIAGRLPFDDPEHGPGVVAWHLSRRGRRAPEGHALSAIVERLLDPDPERRFASTHEVIRAIGAASGRRLRSRATLGAEQVVITGRFVGREREMKRLSGACRRILNGGGAQVLLLRGPEGIGKSRMLQECRVLAQMSGIRVAHAVCGREGPVPLALLRDLLHQILVLVGPDHAVAESHRAVLREVVPELFPSEPRGSRQLPGEHDWMRIKNGIAEFLASVAQLRPLVLLIDDVHAIDELSLSALRWVFQHFSGCPLMLFGTLLESDSGETTAQASRLIETDAHEVLRIGPLQAADVEQILSGVLALSESVRDLAGFVLNLTGGIPLYVEELVRSLLEGQIDILAQQPVSSPEEQEASPRERALGLVSARIGRLPEGEQRVLEALCLFEGVVGADELAAVAMLRTGEAESAIRRLESADLVHVEPTAAEARVLVRSNLFCDAVRGRMPAEQLATMHDRVADRLEATAAGSSPARLSAIAYHALRGTRPEKAVGFSLDAAEEAMSLHAYRHARELLERARKLAAGLGDPAALRRTRALLADTLARLGELDAALLLLGEIAGSSDASRTDVVTARLKIGEIQWAHGRIAAAERSLANAAVEAAELGDPVLLSRADRQHAALLVLLGAPARALVLLERARAALEFGKAPSELAHVVNEIGEVQSQLGEDEIARCCHRESLMRFLALRDRTGVALAHLNLGLVDWKEGMSAAALARLGRCERIARRIGHSLLLARALHHRGVIEAGLGQLTEAVRTLTLSVSMMRRFEAEAGICDGLVQLSSAHHAAGRHEMARLLIEEVVTRRGRLNDLSGVASARVLLGRILCVIGALDESETLLRTAADAAEQLGLDGIAVDALRGLAEVSLRRDRPEEALALLDRQRRVGDGRLDRGVATACDLLRTEVACLSDGADRRSRLGRILRSARAHRDTQVLCEAQRLAGSVRSGARALASLRSAQRCADRSGRRELAWRVRADLGRRLLADGAVEPAVEVMKEAMTMLRALHDELPARRRETYLSDPRKLELKASFADAIDRMGVPVA